MSGSWRELRARIERQAAEIERLLAVATELGDEVERLRAESETFRGKLAEQCGQTLVARAEVERLNEHIAILEAELRVAYKLPAAIEAALEPKP